MKNLKLLICVLSLISDAHPLLAQNVAQYLENGILYQLQTPQFVYAPEDVIAVSYRIINQNDSEINIVTPNSNFCRLWMIIKDTLFNIAPSTPGAFSEQIIFFEAICSQDVSKRIFSRLNFSDGDTLGIRGKPNASSYVIGLPAPTDEKFSSDRINYRFMKSFNSVLGSVNYDTRYDLNADHKIDFLDWLIWARKTESNRYETPQGADLSLVIYIRDKSADVNRDGLVNEQDMNVFVSTMGSVLGESAYSMYMDFTGDGRIDFADFVEFSTLYQSE